MENFVGEPPAVRERDGKVRGRPGLPVPFGICDRRDVPFPVVHVGHARTDRVFPIQVQHEPEPAEFRSDKPVRIDEGELAPVRLHDRSGIPVERSSRPGWRRRRRLPCRWPARRPVSRGTVRPWFPLWTGQRRPSGRVRRRRQNRESTRPQCVVVLIIEVSFNNGDLARRIADGGFNDIEVYAECDVEILISFQVP